MVLAACGFLALALVYMESANIKSNVGREISDLAFLIPITLSLVLSWVAYRRSHGVEARFWLIATMLNCVLLVCEVYWLVIIIRDGTPPPPIYGAFQPLHTLAAVLFLVLLASMIRLADTSAPIQIRWWLDLTSVGAIVYVGVLKFMVDPLFARVADGTPGARLVASVYAAWGLMMLAGGIWILVRPGLMRWRLWERMIGFSIMIYAVGIVLWPVGFVEFRAGQAATERSIFDLILVLGHYLFLLAVIERLMNSDREWPLRRLGPAHHVSGRMVTYSSLTATVVALPVLVIAAVLAPAATLDRSVYAVAATVLATLAVGRTIVSAIENGRLFHAAVTDPLTGLYNHRYFHERLSSELDAARRSGEPLAVVWIDIDDFTHLNRVAGHAAGDALLQTVASALSSSSCEKGSVCRVGGDEFAIVARDCDAGDAAATAEKLHAALIASVAPGATPPTVSGGIACFPDHGDDPVALAAMVEHTARWAHGHTKGRVIAYDRDVMGEPESGEGPEAFEERSRLGAVRALASAVDARLETSGTRSATVAALATALARHLGLGDERVKQIETAALVHDVGMVSLGDEILGKPGPLTESEREAVRRHPVLSEQIAGGAVPPSITPWIRHHHERWDGTGYPDGLRAVAIPLEARILAICDAWDAMISQRPYRGAMTAAEAVAELRACAGTQFDPELVEPLITLVEAFHGL